MEEKSPTIAELLAKKRKLTDLREIMLKSSRKKMNQVDENDGDANNSNKPMTSLMLKPNQKYDNELQDEPNPATPLSHSLKNISNYDPLSPLPEMSPATQELYNVLITDPKLQFNNTSDVIENSDASDEENVPFQEDSDDSVRDPDFNIKTKVTIDESETDCESSDDAKDISKETLTMSGKNMRETKRLIPEKNTKNEIQTSISEIYIEVVTESENVSPILKTEETAQESSSNNTQINRAGSAACVSSENRDEQSDLPKMGTRDPEHDSAVANVDEGDIPTQENIMERNENLNLIIEDTSTCEERTNDNRIKGRSRLDRKASKIRRNTGKSYITEKGKIIPERTSKELGSCRLRCSERITTPEQTQCFEAYWQLGDRDRRAAFVSKSVILMPKLTQKTSIRTLNREYYCKYSLEICNEQKQVCKECFCKILGETKGFVNIIIGKKKLSPNGIIDEDQRGRQPPKNKKTVEDISLVNEHILSFPSYESHYCRKSTGKKYLPADLSIAKMYREYKTTSSNPVSLKIYAKCFHDFNLSFKQPSKDTCNTCDVLNAKIKVADDDGKLHLTAELTEHQYQAEKAYAVKRLDKETAKTDSFIRAYAFDLQQCLPTPYLKTSVSFYKRQLWSFNLTIHDLASNNATCYMWDETIGARGANQIASCLWHFCNSLPSEVKELTFYSDTCGGQNKNNVVAMMFMFLLNNHPTLQKINHKFLISGHSHMECDSDHAIIEKTKKRTQMKINHLYDWVQLVRTCKVQKPFKVIVMTVNDFLDFAELKSKKGPFTVKKVDDSGDKFLWQPIKWLQFNKNNIGKIYFKKNLDCESPFTSINFKKRGKSTIDLFRVNQISKEALPISAEKKKDLMDMIDLIDDSFKEFYVNLKTVGNMSACTDPDLDEDNPDEEDPELQ